MRSSWWDTVVAHVVPGTSPCTWCGSCRRQLIARTSVSPCRGAIGPKSKTNGGEHLQAALSSATTRETKSRYASSPCARIVALPISMERRHVRALGRHQRARRPAFEVRRWAARPAERTKGLTERPRRSLRRGGLRRLVDVRRPHKD